MLLGLTVAIGITGCQQDQTLRAADNPGLLEAIARSGRGDSGALNRAQKPDATPLTPPEHTGAMPVTGRIRATVNGEAILNEEIIASCQHELLAATVLPEPERGKRQAEVYTAALDGLIDREVVLQDMQTRLGAKENKNGQKFLEKLKEASKKEFEKTYLRPMKERFNKKTDQEFKDFLASQGVSLEMTRRHWERQFMMMEYVRNLIFDKIQKEVTHEKIAQYYDTHPDEFKIADMVDWQDMVIATARHPNREAARRFAEVLADRIRRGEDFARLSEQFDDGIACKNPNSAFIGQKHGEIRPVEAEEILFGLNEGEVGPLVEIPTGFHIVRLLKRTHAGMKPFDEKVQKQITDKLRNEVGNREMKAIVKELRDKALIEYVKSE
jgi:parvulin-like peptidyl-prolyl isomerase